MGEQFGKQIMINSIMIEAIAELLRSCEKIPILPSANLEGVTEEMLHQALLRYRTRIRYFETDNGEVER